MPSVSGFDISLNDLVNITLVSKTCVTLLNGNWVRHEIVKDHPTISTEKYEQPLLELYLMLRLRNGTIWVNRSKNPGIDEWKGIYIYIGFGQDYFGWWFFVHADNNLYILDTIRLDVYRTPFQTTSNIFPS